MEPPSVTSRVLVGALALVLFLLSGTMAWAVAEDFKVAQTVPAAVRLITIGGPPVDVTGMTSDQLRACIQTRVVEPLTRDVKVKHGTRTFTLDVDGSKLVSVGVDAMVDQAFRAREDSTLAARVVQSVTGATQTVDIRPQYSLDMTRTRAWVRAIAKTVDKKPVDAVRLVRGVRVYIRPSSTGALVYQQTAVKRIRALIVTAGVEPKRVALPVATLKPKVNESSFGKTIVVDKSERKLYLYNKAKLQKSYRVAVGMPGFPTPIGQFKIVQKRYLPTWRNPGSDWAVDMPAFIPPGPGNPLGTRAMNLDASGIRIHGTNKINSIGTAASHGCIRMLRANVEELYELVQVGAAVYIVP